MMCPDASHREAPELSTDPAASALLIEISTWREQLARSIARNNLAMRSGEISAAVNRIVFSLLLLWRAEDRRLVPEGILREISEADDPFVALMQISRAFGDPWEDTGEPTRQHHAGEADPVIEERVFRKIIGQLLLPDFSCRFSDLPTDTLARVISQYLTRMVRRSAVHQAMIVDIPDAVLSGARAEPTPAMIEYLVTGTLRAAAEERSRREILPLRCIDPACGAGVVLIPMYHQLVAMRVGKRSTFTERKDILFDSVYGLDINPHAVAATRILLLLALCEGETSGTLPADFFTLAKDVFHDLRHTIRCGNALITPDITGDESWAFCPARDRHHLGVFAWTSGFPEIFLGGGFDVVISNPPEGSLATKEWIQQYFQRHFSVYDPAVDRSAYFVEQGLLILRPGGALGCCTCDQWLRGKPGSALRSFLVTREIGEIVDFPCPSGGGKSGCGTSLIIVINRISTTAKKFPAAIIDPVFSGDPGGFVEAVRFPVDPVLLADGGWTLRDTRAGDLLAKLEVAGTPLDEVVMGQIHTGNRAGFDPVFVIADDERKELLRKDPRAKPFFRLLVSGPDIHRYLIAGSRFAIIIPRGWTDAHNGTGSGAWRWFRRRHPAIASRLKKFGEDEPRAGMEGYWWETATCDELTDRHPGILFPAPFRSPSFAFDDGRAILDETVGVIGTSSLYLTGLLNSRLTAFFLFHSARRTGQDFLSGEDLRDLPVYTPDLDEPADRARHDHIVEKVKRLIERKKNVQRGKPCTGPGGREREIAAIGKKIDALVYELYGLTMEEIAFVESTVPNGDSSS